MQCILHRNTKLYKECSVNDLPHKMYARAYNTLDQFYGIHVTDASSPLQRPPANPLAVHVFR